MTSLLGTAYRGATSAASPLAGPLLRWRERHGKEDAARLGERTGIPSRPRPPGDLAWLHGASVGESMALLPLVDALLEKGLAVLVTSGTVTSARVLAERLPAGVAHQFVPLDFPPHWRRFLDHWRPDLAVLAESELWPNLLGALSRRRCPVVLVNARMSDRSARRWALARRFVGEMLGSLDLCLAQTDADAGRFRRLGAPRVVSVGNLKYDVAPPPATAETVAALRAEIGARPVWVAASTHADEESTLVDVHARLAKTCPGVLTIVLPRQPHRGTDLADAAARRGLAVSLRSRGEAMGTAAFYVADTIGEAGLFYRLGEIVFIGRTLGGGGGQSPIEAAKLGNAILHGPLVAKQREIFAALDASGGAFEVADAPALVSAVGRLVADTAARRSAGAAARTAIARQGGATERIIDALGPLLARIAAQGGERR